jgi:hypothetical protein
VRNRSWGPRDSGPRMTPLARTNSNCKRQICPLVREGAPHQPTRNCLIVITIWSRAPDGGLTPRQTGRLTVGRDRTLTWLCGNLNLLKVQRFASYSRMNGLPSAVPRATERHVSLHQTCVRAVCIDKWDNVCIYVSRILEPPCPARLVSVSERILSMFPVEYWHSPFCPCRVFKV